MNKIFAFVLINLFITVSTIQAQEPSNSNCNEETEEKNKALAKEFYEKVWFSNNPETVDKLVAKEYTLHDIGDDKNIKETPQDQKDVAQFFWDNGKMSGSIDYQIAECDLVATRWQWKFEPESFLFKIMGGKNQIPIINVFRFKDGKIVEIWNHRHDIDTAQGNILFIQGLLIALMPCIIFLLLSFVLWRKLRKLKAEI